MKVPFLNKMLNLILIEGKTRQVLIATCLYLGQLVIGYSVAWSGVILPKLQDRDHSPLSELMTETERSLVASVLYVGCLPGPYIVGWVSNIKGRKPCLFCGGVMTAMAQIILALSSNVAMLLSGRILFGFGIGMIAVMNFVYIGEIASDSEYEFQVPAAKSKKTKKSPTPAKASCSKQTSEEPVRSTNMRGILLTVLGIFHTFGAIVVYTSSHFLTYAGTNYVGLACCIAFTLATLLIPESPIFHILQGKDEALKKILKELGRNEDINKLMAEKKEFQESTAQKDWKELFSLRGNRKAVYIVVIINIFQSCSGVMVVLFFAGTIFEKAGSTIDSNISMLIITAFQLIGSFLSPFLVERSGRKVLIVVSSSVCSLAMFLLGIYFYLDHIGNPVIDNIKWFPLAMLILFFIGYDFGLGIIPNALIGEMFTANVRSKGSAVALTSSWAAGFLMTTVFGSFIESIGYIAFWIFAGICIGAVFFTIFCVLETKGKSLLEIQDILSKI